MTQHPHRGLTTEATTLNALERVAYAAGDQLTPTGTTPGLVAPPGATSVQARVCVETKNEARPLSVTAWATLLAESCKKRSCHAALGLVPRIEQMPGQRRLHLLSPTSYLFADGPTRDDTDLLTAASVLLRAHTWADVPAQQKPTHQIDLPALRAGLLEGLAILDGLVQLTRHSSATRRSLDQLDTSSTTLRAELRDRIQIALSVLAIAPAGARPGCPSLGPAAVPELPASPR